MNILVYFPYNQRTVEQQSVMEMLVKQGHKVIFLTTCRRGYLHDYVQELGIITESSEVDEREGKIKFYTHNLKKLASVIGKYKIGVVIAHQQTPALIAGILRKFKKFRLIYIRHNSDEDYQNFPFKAKWLNRLINWLTPVKVAPSTVVKNFWSMREGVPEKKICKLNYGYNFSQYEQPDPAEVQKIKADFPAALRLLSIARMVPAKRHREMFSIVARLVQDGIDCKLVCLGPGPMKNELEEEIKKLHLEKNIFLLGRKENVMDYIEAADVFIHLSRAEASNSAVKELGLRKKTVIVCKGVGDFEEYIIHNQNGFLVDKESPSEETYEILRKISEGKIDKTRIGQQLFETVTTAYDINNIVPDYDLLLKKVIAN